MLDYCSNFNEMSNSDYRQIGIDWPHILKHKKKDFVFLEGPDHQVGSTGLQQSTDFHAIDFTLHVEATGEICLHLRAENVKLNLE